MEQKKLLAPGMVFSLLLHLTILAIAVIGTWNSRNNREFKYFVSLVQLPGGGGGGQKATSGHVRELVEYSKVKAKPKLTYPTRKRKPRRRYVRPRKSSVVVKKKTAGSGIVKKRVTYGGEGPTISFGGGSGVGEGGGKMQLGNFPFPFYLITVKERIGLNWNQLMGGKKLGVEIWVYFKVNREGRIIEIKLEKPCGISRFDSYALKAVKDAEPFPRLPKNYDGEYLAIRVIFE